MKTLPSIPTKRLLALCLVLSAVPVLLAGCGGLAAISGGGARSNVTAKLLNLGPSNYDLLTNLTPLATNGWYSNPIVTPVTINTTSYADALKAAVGADVALTNGGGIRADKQYQAGQKLTRRDILSEMPFGNTTVLLEVTGAQIKDALENGVSQVRELGGRFPQVSGIVAEVDVKEPVGSRVKSVKINGQPLDPAKIYKLATNDFVARGGDGYRMFANAKSLIDVSASQLMASQVIDYVAKAGKISPKVEGRVVLR